MFGRVGIAVGAGLVAGSLVGGAEALYALQSVLPAEYQALIYAMCLYGVCGAGLGLVAGILLLPARRMGAERRWMLSLVLVGLCLGGMVLRAVVDRDAFEGRGVPADVGVALAAGVLTFGAVTAWIGTNLLTKTPLRGLATARGTTLLWGAGVGLGAVFSAMPAPGATDLPLPARVQDASFEEKPDILLVVVDGLRADAVSPAQTPALDRFAKEAITFGQAIAAAPRCRPATASLFSALPVSSHGCASASCILSPNVRTLAEVLADAGYLAVGFPNGPEISSVRGLGQGFDRFVYRPHLPLFATESTSALTLYHLLREQLPAVVGVASEPVNASASEQVASFSSTLGEIRGRRGFYFLHLSEPAGPWLEGDAPADGVGERYAAGVMQVDAALGQLFDDLRRDGIFDTTLIVVTADHGVSLGERSASGVLPLLYDEDVHVPLWVKLPRGERAGTVVGWQVRQEDIAPTITSAAGVAPDPSWQGEPLIDERFEEGMDLMGAAGDGLTPTSPTWATHPFSRDALSEGAADGYVLRALRRGGHKVIEALEVPATNPLGQRPVQFFDLGADPGERHDLDGRGLSEEAAMQAALQREATRARTRAVAGEDEQISPEERQRRCALGYLSGPDCEPNPP